MSYVPFSTFCQWVAEGFGLSFQTQRASVVSKANLARQHIYLIYDRAQMSLDAESCFDVEEFPTSCHECDNRYFGITLPHDMMNVEAAWKNNTPVKLFSKWRESVVGIEGSNSCRLQFIDLGNIFPTERDIDPRHPSQIQIKADRREDCGKEVILNYIDIDGENRKERIVLTLDYKLTEHPAIGFVRPAGVQLPEGRQHSITIAHNDRILSIYSPLEGRIPSYKRVKITGVCAGDQVLVKSARKFVPLFFDEDVAEVDNRLAVREIATMLSLRDSKEPGLGYERKADYHAQLAYDYLIGEKAREAGKATIRQFFIGGRSVNRSGLHKRRR